MRPVPSQPGIWASDRGDVWSTRGKGWRKLRTQRGGGRTWDSRGGYLRVSIRDYRRPPPAPTYPLPVHLLVTEAWYGPRPDEHESDHKNENHLDNRPDNLQWLHWRRNLDKRNKSKVTMGTDEDWEDML